MERLEVKKCPKDKIDRMQPNSSPRVASEQKVATYFGFDTSDAKLGKWESH